MSVESAKAFIERIKTDREFAKMLSECKDAEARLAFVKGAGYSFTPEEIRNLAGELADDVLSAVVGGIGMSGSGTYVK